MRYDLDEVLKCYGKYDKSNRNCQDCTWQKECVLKKNTEKKEIKCFKCDADLTDLKNTDYYIIKDMAGEIIKYLCFKCFLEDNEYLGTS